MKNDSVTIRLNPLEVAQLHALADELAMTKSDAIRLAIRELAALRGMPQGRVKAPRRELAPTKRRTT